MNLARLDNATLADAIQWALDTEDSSEFWLLTGWITARLQDLPRRTAKELANQLWEAGHENPWNEAKARELLREFQG